MASRICCIPYIFIFLFVFELSNVKSVKAETDAEAASFIKSLADEAVTSLTGEGLSKEERRGRFRALMLDKFAFKVIAKWVLGRYWRNAAEDEKREYLSLFEELMVVTYADRFSKYSGEKLTIKNSEVRSKIDTLVHSVLTRSKGAQPIKVAWRVRKAGKKHKIIDVMVEGVSMGIAQKREFASVVRKSGGKIGGLLDELRKRLASNL